MVEKKKTATTLLPLVGYERNTLASWNCYNPLILTKENKTKIGIARENLLNHNTASDMGAYEILLYLNKEYFEKILLHIIKALDDNNIPPLCAALNDFSKKIGKQTYKDFWAGAGLFKGCNLFIVDKYNRGNLTLKEAIPGTKILPGIIAKEHILKIEKFPYLDRLKCLSGLTPGESIEKIIKRWLGVEELPKELLGIREGDVPIEVLQKIDGQDQTKDNSKIKTSYPMTDKTVITELKEKFKGKKLSEPIIRELEKITKDAQWTDEEKADICGISREWYTKKRIKYLGKNSE